MKVIPMRQTLDKLRKVRIAIVSSDFPLGHLGIQTMGPGTGRADVPGLVFTPQISVPGSPWGLWYALVSSSAYDMALLGAEIVDAECPGWAICSR